MWPVWLLIEDTETTYYIHMNVGYIRVIENNLLNI